MTVDMADRYSLYYPVPQHAVLRLPADMVYPQNAFLRELLNQFRQNGDLKLITVDFINCQFMDSSTIGMFIAFLRRVERNDLRIRIINVSQHLLEIFEVIRMNSLFQHLEILGDEGD